MTALVLSDNMVYFVVKVTSVPVIAAMVLMVSNVSTGCQGYQCSLLAVVT